MGVPERASGVRRFGRYALHEPIASGGMATVHYGRLLGPVGFSRTVAVKRLHAEHARDPEFVMMFLDEARLAARIRHPNVVPTINVVAEDGELFLVMEYVEGEALSRLVRAVSMKGELVPVPIAASVLSGALRGLHAAHEAKSERGEPLQIVHRDVTPQNVLVGKDGLAHVVDFGVARATGRLQTTRDGQIKGKLSYMAPELFAGERATRSADIWGAGVMLWETLVSRRLFGGESEAEIVGRVLAHKITPASELAPDIPKALDDVITRALATEPADRFATAEDMANAIDDCVRLATPAQVSAWVVRTVGDVLDARSHLIREIESSSPRDIPADWQQLIPASKPSLPQQVPVAADRTQSGMSELSAIPGASPRPGARRFLIPAIAGALLASAIASAVVIGVTSRGHAPATSTPSAETTAISTQPAALSIASSATTAEPASKPSAESIASAAPSARPAPPSDGPKPAPRGSGRAPTAAPKNSGAPIGPKGPIIFSDPG